VTRPDPFAMPVIRVEWTRADGSLVTREWSLNDGPPKPFPPPAFIENPRRRWDHPQDPITLLGDIRPGFESEAEAWLEAFGKDE